MLTAFLKPPVVLEIQISQIILHTAQEKFSYPRSCEPQALIENILRNLQTAPRYFQIIIDPALFTALPPLAAQTSQQLLWKISENLPCPMEHIVFYSDLIDEHLHQVHYALKEPLQNLIQSLEQHDFQIDAVTASLKPVEQILYRKPWFTWQLIQTQSLNLHRGLVVLGLVCLILQIGAGFLNNREPQFWNLKNQQQALQKFQNSPQHHFTQVLAALNSLPAQSRTQHIRFNAQGIELRGESLRDSHAILKHWFQQMGAELVHQESRGTANAQIVFTAQINL